MWHIVRYQCFLTLFILLLVFPIHGKSQTSTIKTEIQNWLALNNRDTLRIGTYDSAPFVIYEKKRISGMAIELWENIANKYDLNYKYVEYPSTNDLIEATNKEEIDIAITNLTITEKRAQKVHFTQPWYQGGLRLMVNSRTQGGFKNLVRGLYDSGFIHAYSILLISIVLGTILITLFDRKFNPEYPKSWKDGLAEGFYSIMSIVTSGKSPNRKNYFGWLGRIWQGIWLVCGVTILAFVTSSVTSVMTTIQLHHQIENLKDIGQDPIGVHRNTEAEDYAKENNLNYKVYPNLTEAAKALQSNKVVAILGDDPILRYYIDNNADLKFKVVGRNITYDKYGFALPIQSALNRPVTLAILNAVDSGYIEELKLKYFGEND